MTELQHPPIGMDRLETDIVIVGSGGAGLRAAIEARQEGRQVLVLSKGPIGRGTSTIMAGGVFAGALEGHSPEAHLRQTLVSGRGLNVPALAEILAQEGAHAIFQVVEWGLPGEKVSGSFFTLGKAPGWGAAIISVLADRARLSGVRFMANAAAAEILVRDGRACGLLAYDWRKDRLVCISSKAVLLATGGAGALYRFHDNPQRMMGDGYALAFRCGAELLDMEFVQFYPIGLVKEGRPPFLLPPVLGDWGGLVNDRGEDIHEKYGIDQRPAAVKMRDTLSRAIWTELYEEKVGAVLCDVSGIPDGQWKENRLAASAKELLFQRYQADRHPLSVHPMAHHVMGGVRIDGDGATSVEGLFAAGECTGGLHGANRMGGNALTETLVFGARAGRAAARYARRASMPVLHPEDRPAVPESWSEGEQKRGDDTFRTIRRNLQELMWEQVGIVRHAKGLEEAMRELELLERRVSGRAPRGARERLEALELSNGLLAARLITTAALERTESRGAHFRKDHPEQDDGSWLAHVVLQRSPDGGIGLSRFL